MNRRLFFTTAALWAVTVGTLLAQPFSADQQAEAVYGQNGSFKTNDDHVETTSARTLYLPMAVRLDAQGRLYIVDTQNNRILRFDDPLNSDVADAVYGQFGSMSRRYSSPLTAWTLYFPEDVAFDDEGRMYVADYGNHRVLRFDHPLTSDTADAVYGQADFKSAQVNRGSGSKPSDSGMAGPRRLCLDREGRLYVADAGNNRVLRFSDPLHSTVADVVYGQPDMSSGDENTGGISAQSMADPRGLAIDAAGRLYVADMKNYRVLRFSDPLHSTVADAVYGQPRLDTAVTSGSDVVLPLPKGLAIDGFGRLYVSAVNGVSVFNAPLGSSVADVVIGPAPAGDASGRYLKYSSGICLDGANGKLYVADSYNNRVLRYGTIGGVPLGVESEESFQHATWRLDLR